MVPAGTRPGRRTAIVPDTSTPVAGRALLGAGRHGLRRSGFPFGCACHGRHSCRAVATRDQTAGAVSRLHLPAPPPDRTLLVVAEGATRHRNSLRQNRRILCGRHSYCCIVGLDQGPASVSIKMQTAPSFQASQQLGSRQTRGLEIWQKLPKKIGLRDLCIL